MLQQPDNIVGIQGHLWSETVRNPSQLHYMIFPRMLALAERAWHKVRNCRKTCARFQVFVGKSLPYANLAKIKRTTLCCSSDIFDLLAVEAKKQ